VAVLSTKSRCRDGRRPHCEAYLVIMAFLAMNRQDSKKGFDVSCFGSSRPPSWMLFDDFAMTRLSIDVKNHVRKGLEVKINLFTKRCINITGSLLGPSFYIGGVADSSHWPEQAVSIVGPCGRMLGHLGISLYVCSNLMGLMATTFDYFLARPRSWCQNGF